MNVRLRDFISTIFLPPATGVVPEAVDGTIVLESDGEPNCQSRRHQGRHHSQQEAAGNQGGGAGQEIC